MVLDISFLCRNAQIRLVMIFTVLYYMTSIVTDIRELGSQSAFNQYFRHNQNVTVTHNGTISTVTAMQNGSTPGIVLRKPIVFEPKSTYEVLVLARSADSVFIWAYDDTHDEELVDAIAWTRITDDDNANHRFVTNRTDRSIDVKLGILFEKPAEIGDQFTLEAFIVVKREGSVNGLWRRFEHDHLLISDRYDIVNKKWVQTLTECNS